MDLVDYTVHTHTTNTEIAFNELNANYMDVACRMDGYISIDKWYIPLDIWLAHQISCKA